ncbi:MAG: TusE/DsrC/DsvC family sulfur relay protein [Betaproteobacteria bacterium]|nr:TusE/DsrC/DsvC family sulfur relay protein [Betaproteobacteria bacterium]
MILTHDDPGRPIIHAPIDPDFPHAPFDWTCEEAERVAFEEGIVLTEEHWEAINGLQNYYARHEDQPSINVHDLHDALDEHFHSRGGIKQLYLLFPGGPICQGCRIAGLKAPFLACDPNYGSVS